MVAKEWWEARWKFVLAAVVVLAFVAFAPRPYGEIQEQAEFQIKTTRAELESPERFMPPQEALPPGYTRARYAEYLRNDLERMRQPDYPVELAGQELEGVYEAGKYMVLVPLAALLGVALVSGEVSRGSILLLLSRPIGRTRIFLTKYSVGASLLLATALLSVVGLVVSRYAHGYPAAAINVAEILASAGLFWLGTLSVLGVAVLASVLFGDVIRSAIATLVACYVAISAPSWISEIASTVWLLTNEQGFMESPMAQEGWYESFEIFKITRYWSFLDPYESGPFVEPLAFQQPDPMLSVLVCSIAALLPLLAAFWLFRRKSY